MFLQKEHIFLLLRCKGMREADVPMGTVQSKPLARLQAHLGIECSPLCPSQSHCVFFCPGVSKCCQPQQGCPLNHLKCKTSITKRIKTCRRHGNVGSLSLLISHIIISLSCWIAAFCHVFTVDHVVKQIKPSKGSLKLSSHTNLCN